MRSSCCTRRVERAKTMQECLSMSVPGKLCKASGYAHLRTSRLPVAAPAHALGRPLIPGDTLHHHLFCCKSRACEITHDYEHIVLASRPSSGLSLDQSLHGRAWPRGQRTTSGWKTTSWSRQICRTWKRAPCSNEQCRARLCNSFTCQRTTG